MKTVVSMDVTFVWSEVSTTCLNMSVQEAYNVMMMPSFAGFISSMVPVYGLSPVSEPENKE